MRVLRLIENLTLGTAAVGYLTESMHGAGSPRAQRIMINRSVNMEEKKAAAKRLSGIEPDSLSASKQKASQPSRRKAF
jgi:4-hydroxybutyryl-CoA dehydratase/vinylacetyl-CoA-Delta-isomerase